MCTCCDVSLLKVTETVVSKSKVDERKWICTQCLEKCRHESDSYYESEHKGQTIIWHIYLATNTVEIQKETNLSNMFNVQ